MGLTSSGKADSFEILHECQNHAIVATLVAHAPAPENATALHGAFQSGLEVSSCDT